MAKIKITLDHTIVDGEEVTFRAPCNCTEVEGLSVAYPTLDESSAVNMSKAFVFADAHGNALTGIGNLFSAGACVSVILDIENSYAFIKNADTNRYLENRLTDLYDRIIYSEDEPVGVKGQIWLKPAD